jgi:hypothetical protein
MLDRLNLPIRSDFVLFVLIVPIVPIVPISLRRCLSDPPIGNSFVLCVSWRAGVLQFFMGFGGGAGCWPRHSS